MNKKITIITTFSLLTIIVMVACIGASKLSYNDYEETKSAIRFVSNPNTLPNKGLFHEFDVDVNFDKADITKSKGTVTIDVSSIDTGIPARNAHLRTADFFEVEKYPTAELKINQVTKVMEKPALIIKIEGALTIKGRTKNVSFQARVHTDEKDGTTYIEGGFPIKRSEYGITYGLGKGIEDEVLLVFYFVS